MNVISEKEYSFSNALFWNVMLHHHIQAFDEERDVNFDEVWDEELVPTLLDEKKYKKYWCWLSQIDLKTSENQGEIENPRTLTLPIGSDIVLTIEFHPCCTYYFLNDTLIGEVSGNFHLKYLTYSELMRITKEIYGDVLFTKYGVSGFAILDISQIAAYNLSLYQDVKIAINFFPKTNRNDLADQIQGLFKTLANQNAVDILTGMISNKIAPVLLDICKIKQDTKAGDINSKQIKAISYQLNQWKLKVTDTQGFGHAEASGGGVRTAEVDNKTYESKLCKGLYFAGEILDIVGNRGGFNLQFAWASGYLVGKSLAK